MNINHYSTEMRLFITLAFVFGPTLLAGAYAEYTNTKRSRV